jgi:diadenosine tetraphosphate (Ap4A) HIT family hydrolase/ADP-ribose pyrophosphatase YjhB (NUDIX family)
VECGLCSPDLSPVLSEGRNWRWVLNSNQDLLGKSMLVLRRHTTSVTSLTEPEWGDLHPFVSLVTQRTEAVLTPARMNYAFLGNVDNHVHLHVMPRYAEPVQLAGEVFDDTGYPGHYTVGKPRLVSDGVLGEIADRLRMPPMEQIIDEQEAIALPRRVRPTALCVLSRGEEILVAALTVPGTELEVLRPPGGEIRFGERAEVAVVREIREEVGVEVVDVRLLGVIDDVFTHEDEIGHEVVFVFDARVEDSSFYEQAQVRIQEEIGSPVHASWLAIDALRAEGRHVVPDGLLDLVEPQLKSDDGR